MCVTKKKPNFTLPNYSCTHLSQKPVIIQYIRRLLYTFFENQMKATTLRNEFFWEKEKKGEQTQWSTFTFTTMFHMIKHIFVLIVK